MLIEIKGTREVFFCAAFAPLLRYHHHSAPVRCASAHPKFQSKVACAAITRTATQMDRSGACALMIGGGPLDVRYGSDLEVELADADFRFAPRSRPPVGELRRPFSARLGNACSGELSPIFLHQPT